MAVKKIHQGIKGVWIADKVYEETMKELCLLRELKKQVKSTMFPYYYAIDFGEAMKAMRVVHRTDGPCYLRPPAEELADET